MKRAASALVVFLACALGLPGCGGSSSSPPAGTSTLTGPVVVAVICDYTDDFARDVPVQVRGMAAGKSQVDGRAILPNVVGSALLIVGDSRTTPTLLVPFTGTQDGAFLERPVHLPSLESGIAASLPSSISAVTTVSGDQLPGVSLTLASGSAVGNNPNNVEVRVLGLSPSRLPVPIKGGSNLRSETRAAYLVEPHGVSFSPAATLRVPMLEAAGNAPFDAYRVDPASGAWVKHADNVAPVGTGSILSFDLAITQGTAYAVVPRVAAAGTTVSGRIVSGGTPVAGYRAACWNRVSAPTGADGTFTITDVPTRYGVFLVRAFPHEPGKTFQPELVLATSTSSALSDITVVARPADGIRPTVRTTSPADNATNVSRSTQVVVTFSEAIDRALKKPFKLVGPKGEVAGTHSFDSAFAVRFRPTEKLDPSDTYTILIERAVQDLAGNLLDDSMISFRFTTQAGAPDPDPTDTLAFGIDPLTARQGDRIKIPGRNYTGGTTVRFGGLSGIVRSETATEIEAEVPSTTPAGDVTVALDAGGTAIASLQPLVLDLRASIARIYSGTTNETPLVALNRSMPPAQIVIDGQNVGGASVTIDGVGIAAVDSNVSVGGTNVATGRTVNLGIPAPVTLQTGPVVVRGANGKPSKTYRFLQVKE